jgi:hypothetical protein
MKNSTKYKFVPLFKQIKVNRALVKAFDEYVISPFVIFLSGRAFRYWTPGCSADLIECESPCVWFVNQGGHGLCQLHTCCVFVDGVYAKE